MALPPLFGAPWERREEEETFSRSRREEFFAVLHGEGMEAAERKLAIWVPGVAPDVVRSFATAISVMEHRSQTRIASDLLNFLLNNG